MGVHNPICTEIIYSLNGLAKISLSIGQIIFTNWPSGKVERNVLESGRVSTSSS